MKRAIAFAAGLVVLAAVAGCTPSDGTEAAPTSPGSGELSGSLEVWVDDTRTPVVQAWADAHPEVDVEIVTMPAEFGAVTTKIALANNAGSGWPDVVFPAAPDEVASLAANPVSFAAPLEDVIPASVLDGFADGTVERCTFDGHVFCLPNDIAQTVLWYNAALMAEFGYEVPTTMDEYKELGIKLATEHPGYVVGNANDIYGLQPFYGSSGCPFSTASEDQTSVTIDLSDEKCQAATDVLAPLVQNGTVSSLGLFTPEFTELGTSNKILMLPGASWFGDFLLKTYGGPDGQFAAADMPLWPGEDVPYAGAEGGGLWVMSKHTENPDAASALITDLTTDPEVQTVAATYPADKAAAEIWLEAKAADPFYASDPVPALETSAGLINPSLTYIRYFAQLVDSYNQTVLPALSSSDPAAALEEWESQLSRLAETAGYQVSNG